MTHVLAAVWILNRLERVGETLRHALNSLATDAPDWLRAVVPTDWFDRYGRRIDKHHLDPPGPLRWRAVHKLGYQPYAPARSLRLGTSNLVLVVWPEGIVDSYTVPSIEALAAAVAEIGYSLIWQFGFCSGRLI